MLRPRRERSMLHLSLEEIVGLVLIVLLIRPIWLVLHGAKLIYIESIFSEREQRDKHMEDRG